MNEGKRFELNFKKSVPDDVYYLRLPDSSIGFDIENSTQRFALRSPYDCILYREGKMYCLELKSTSNTAVSFAGSNPMIKEHQVKQLINALRYGCEAGFVINFRNGDTYFLPIDKFVLLTTNIGKKSINESDVSGCSFWIPSTRLRTNYRYDLSILFKAGD